jgi:hypothetical protein
MTDHGKFRVFDESNCLGTLYVALLKFYKHTGTSEKSLRQCGAKEPSLAMVMYVLNLELCDALYLLAGCSSFHTVVWFRAQCSV